MNSDNSYVRFNLILRTDTPTWVLDRLVDDKEPNVRIGIAMHKNSTTEILQKLTNDPNDTVQEWLTTRTAP